MSHIDLQRPHPEIALLTLNRPEKLNALSFDLVEDLHGALDDVGSDNSARVLILTGAGRGFCSGLDLTALGPSPAAAGTKGPRSGMRSQERIADLPSKLRRLPQPVIAAVNGPAAGLGLALTLGSDIRFASRKAVFRAAFINIGLSNCDMGTSWLFPRLVGASRAHELMLTGRRFDADEALRIGLLADVVEEERLLERAVQAAQEIAALAPWGVRLTKRGMWSALEIPSEQAAIEYEDRQQIMATFSKGVPEAAGAFLEKRPANFDD